MKGGSKIAGSCPDGQFTLNLYTGIQSTGSFRIDHWQEEFGAGQTVPQEQVAYQLSSPWVCGMTKTVQYISLEPSDAGYCSFFIPLGGKYPGRFEELL